MWLVSYIVINGNTGQVNLRLDAGRVASDTEEGAVEEPEEEHLVRKKRKIEEEVNRKLTIIGVKIIRLMLRLLVLYSLHSLISSCNPKIVTLAICTVFYMYMYM